MPCHSAPNKTQSSESAEIFVNQEFTANGELQERDLESRSWQRACGIGSRARRKSYPVIPRPKWAGMHAYQALSGYKSGLCASMETSRWVRTCFLKSNLPANRQFAFSMCRLWTMIGPVSDLAIRCPRGTRILRRPTRGARPDWSSAASRRSSVNKEWRNRWNP